MAIRGTKPKPALLRLITKGGHRPIPQELTIPEGYDNGLEPPKPLRKRQRQLWDTYVRRAPWLTALDIPRAHMWVELHAEWERKPEAMVASRIGQLRTLGSELGLDPSSRARLGAGSAQKPKKDPAAKYLT